MNTFEKKEEIKNVLLNSESKEIKESNELIFDFEKNFKENTSFLNKNDSRIEKNLNFFNEKDQINSSNFYSKYTKIIPDNILTENKREILLKNFEDKFFVLKQYLEKNNYSIKSYFQSELGEKAQKNKTFSYKEFDIDNKIDFVFDNYFNKNKKENFSEIKNLNKNCGSLFDNQIKLNEVLLQGKEIVKGKLEKDNFLFDKFSDNLFSICLLRYLLEINGLKVKLEIFRDLFNTSISTISKSCKIFKIKNLLNK